METSVLLHHKYGKPEEEVCLSTYELPSLEPDQVLVEMLFAAINPADLNMIEGTYYTQPTLPCILGNEGVGSVVECGSQVSLFKTGDRVIMPVKSKDNWVGFWAEKFVVKASYLIKVPKGISDDQAAMLTINPVTAYQLITRFVGLNEGDTILQNGANSSVGRWVIYFAKKMGYKTINLVRRESLIDELKAIGADTVLIDQDGVNKQIRELSGNISLGLNMVGGQSAKELVKSLHADGVMVTYGAMSKEPITISNGALIYKNIWLTGFNRTKWIEEAPIEEVQDTYRDLFEWMGELPMDIPIEKIYQFDQASEAIRHAGSEKRRGKILLQA